MQPQRIAIIGNVAAGKTVLARRLAQIYELPLTHVDTLQFLPGLNMRPYPETIATLQKIHTEPKWIIDGFGPLDILEQRFQIADQIIFIDLPVWRNFWWLTKRQVRNIFSPRPELPEDCSELSWEHTVRLYKTIIRIHRRMRPELLRILARPGLRERTRWVRSMGAWKKVYGRGF